MATGPPGAARRRPVSAVVLESPFADFADAAAAQMERLGLPAGPGGGLHRWAVRLAERSAGADFASVRPVDLSPECRSPSWPCFRRMTPIFPADAADRFEAALRGRPEVWGPDACWRADAGHLMAVVTDPAEYHRRLREFLAAALDVPAPAAERVAGHSPRSRRTVFAPASLVGPAVPAADVTAGTAGPTRRAATLFRWEHCYRLRPGPCSRRSPRSRRHRHSRRRAIELHVVPIPVKSPRLLGMSMDDDGFIWLGSTHRARLPLRPAHRRDRRRSSCRTTRPPARPSASGDKVYLLGQSYPKLIIYDRAAKKFTRSRLPVGRSRTCGTGRRRSTGGTSTCSTAAAPASSSGTRRPTPGRSSRGRTRRSLPSGGRYVAARRRGLVLRVGLHRRAVQADRHRPPRPEDATRSPASSLPRRTTTGRSRSPTPRPTLFYPHTLKGRLVPFDFKRRRWCKPIDVPRVRRAVRLHRPRHDPRRPLVLLDQHLRRRRPRLRRQAVPLLQRPAGVGPEDAPRSRSRRWRRRTRTTRWPTPSAPAATSTRPATTSASRTGR